MARREMIVFHLLRHTMHINMAMGRDGSCVGLRIERLMRRRVGRAKRELKNQRKI
jgi:hypothetical protein